MELDSSKISDRILAVIHFNVLSIGDHVSLNEYGEAIQCTDLEDSIGQVVAGDKTKVAIRSINTDKIFEFTKGTKH